MGAGIMLSIQQLIDRKTRLLAQMREIKLAPRFDQVRYDNLNAELLMADNALAEQRQRQSLGADHAQRT